MNFFEGRRSSRSSKMVWDGSESSNSDEDVYKDNEGINNLDWLAALYTARDKILNFIEDLGDHKQTELREDVTSHCENSVRNEKNSDIYISSDMISKIVNIRIQKMIKNKRIKKNWSQEDVKILIWLISKYADVNRYQDIEREIINDDWEFIATLIPGVTAESCMFKWLSLKKINLATNNWSEQQSLLLGSIVRQQSKDQRKNIEIKDWKNVSQKLYKLNTSSDKIFRNAKQCRQHWNCYLNPNLKKGPWKPEEDIKLLKRIQENKGSKKWSQIVKEFDGRTENALKNRYTLIIDKQRKQMKGKPELQLVQDYLQRCYVQQFTSIIKTESSDEIERRSMGQFDDDREFKDKKEQMVTVEDFRQFDKEEQKAVPVKIQKFKFENFSGMNKNNFLKFIQPGIIHSDGSFSKIQDKLILRKVQSMN